MMLWWCEVGRTSRRISRRDRASRSRRGGILQGVSVNSAPGATLEELTLANSQTGYPGILNNQVGMTTAGAIRRCGGTIVPSPTRTNPHHATLGGLTPEQASGLFQPTTPNPNRRKDE